MTVFRKGLSFLICVLILGSSSALSSQDPLADLTARCRKHIAQLPKGSKVAISVVSLATSETLAEVSSDTLLIPASLMKLFTAATALDRLGPAFQYQTKIYALAPVSQGSVSKLYLKGSGDPSIVPEELWKMTHNLAFETGIRKVETEIVLDDEYFDKERQPQEWSNNDESRSYSAPISALSFQFNSVRFMIGPTDGKSVIVRWDPESPYLNVVNNVRMGGSDQINFSRTEKADGDLYTLSGTFRHGEAKTFYRSISQPTLYTGINFSEFLRREGIDVPKVVHPGKTPENVELLLTHTSKELSLILRDMGKYSNNFIAEHVVKTLGAEIVSVPGTTAKGCEVIQKYLAEVGLSPTFTLVDGSGLSRENRFSARHITTLLANVYKKFEHAPEFLSMLPIAQIDGTLKDRFAKTSSLSGQVRAKTGSLHDVASLAGYVVTQSNEPIAFAILINDATDRFKNLNVIDAIVTEISQFER